jgi:DNA-binding NarL/FixJ family response regulator
LKGLFRADFPSKGAPIFNTYRPCTNPYKRSVMNIRVLIYEDNQHQRNALSALVGGTSGYDLVGSFADCYHVESEVRSLQPDVVLMDIDFKGCTVNGIEGVARLKKAYPKAEVLMLTVFGEEEGEESKIFDAICAGATGYLLKKTPPAKLLESIQEVFEGGAPMSPLIARKALQMFPKEAAQREVDLSLLTKREMEVLELLSEGNSYKMIAEEMGISNGTVPSFIKRIYAKLHVHSAAEAIAKAFLGKGK